VANQGTEEHFPDDRLSSPPSFSTYPLVSAAAVSAALWSTEKLPGNPFRHKVNNGQLPVYPRHRTHRRSRKFTLASGACRFLAVTVMRARGPSPEAEPFREARVDSQHVEAALIPGPRGWAMLAALWLCRSL